MTITPRSPASAEGERFEHGSVLDGKTCAKGSVLSGNQQNGRLLSAILARNPHISGVLFDRLAGVASAMKGAGGPLPRTDFVTGDFFESVPPGCDMYLIKKVIHDWDDKQAVEILRNCRDAMSPDGKVLVLETIVPPGNEPAFIKLIDANMLVVTGGKERTEAEYSALFAKSGLRLERVIETAQPISILEAVRA